jgi:uncharacterized SAM-binding protein YcdF (DUF218 family)
MKPVKKIILLSALVLSLLVFTSIFFFHERILIGLGKYLVYEEPLEKCDAIMILAGDSTERVIEAADLYNSGWAKKIIIPLEPTPQIWPEIERRKLPIRNPKEETEYILVSMGIDKNDIIYPEKMTDRTIEEAFALKTLTKQYPGFRCVITVTSRYHTKRASKIFNSVFNNSGLKIITHATTFDDFSPTDWWKRPRYVRNIINEYIKLLTMIFY